jgi:hypothetical protein
MRSTGIGAHIERDECGVVSRGQDGLAEICDIEDVYRELDKGVGVYDSVQYGD